MARPEGNQGNSRGRARDSFSRRLASEALESRLLLSVGDFLRTIDNPSTTLQPLSEAGTAVALDGDLIVVGAPWDDSAGRSDVGQAHVYERSTGTLLRTIQSQFPAPGGRFGHSIDISDNRLLSASPFADTGAIDAGIVELFDASDGTPLLTIPNPNPAKLDYFGQSIAIDGDHIVVGAYRDDTNALDAGIAYVFSANDGSLLHSLSAPDPSSSDYFGFSVAISGNTIAVGARRADINATDDGAVYLFDTTTGSFDREIINPTPASFDSFGRSVALSGDTVVIGADGDDVGAPGSGAAYVFAVSSGELVHSLLNPTPSFVDLFGYAVGISGDNIVIGAIRADEGTPDSGAAYLFSASTGELLSDLPNPTPADLDVYGAAVAVDSETVVVGAYWDDTAGTDAGAAYVFQSAALMYALPNPTLGSYDYFGYSVAVEGNLVVVGAPFEDVDNLTDAGAVYLHDAAMEDVLFKITNPQPSTSDSFGYSVAISGDLVVVGAYRADRGASESGIAYVFDATTGDLVSTLLNPTPNHQDFFGFSVAIWNDHALVGAHRDDADALDAGSAYLFDAVTGTLLATISNPTPADFDYFGYSLAISNDAIVIGAYQDDTGANNAGSVYVFDRWDATTMRQFSNPTPADSDQFGLAVAIWGTTLAVGAPRKDLGEFDAGAVYLFHAFDGELRHTIFDAAPQFGGFFGGAISMSDNLLAVGAHRRDFPSVDGAGSVDLFDATTGIPIRQLINPTRAENDFFGWSVSMGSNITAVGTPLVDGGTTDRGAVSLFYSQENEAPFVMAGGPYVGLEGVPVEFDGVDTFDDRDALDALLIEWDFDYDEFEFDVEATGRIPALTFEDGFPARQMAVRVTDRAGLATIATTTLEVAITEPILTVDQLMIEVSEAEVATNAGSLSHPGEDTIELTASVGTIVVHDDDTWSWSFLTMDGPADSQTVTVTATDQSGSQSSVAFDLQVNNVPPELSIQTASIKVLSGTPATNSGTYTDIGNDDIASLSSSVGTIVDQGNGDWDWSLPDVSVGDAQTVTITITDSDMGTATESFELGVTKLVTDSSNISVEEGAMARQGGRYSSPGEGLLELSASIGDVVDNGDQTWSWAYDVGDGPSDSQSITITARYDGAEVYAAEFDLVVINASPTLVVDQQTITVAEGAVATNSGSVTDPGGDDISLKASVGTVVNNADGSWNWSHTAGGAPEDTQTVSITATDSDGAETSVSFGLEVTNELPSLEVDDEIVTVLEGVTAHNSGAFADPGGDAVTLSATVGTVDQGDGIWNWSLPMATVMDSQDVTITATDEDGAMASTSFELVVKKILVDSPSVTVDEGSSADNGGRYAVPAAGIIELSASVGVVVDGGDGTWSWSHDVQDGPADSQTVTISAVYDGAETFVAEFELVANNLAPSVMADEDFVEVVRGDVAGNTGTYIDPGNDNVVLTASIGIIVDNGDGTWSWSLDDPAVDESISVIIEATDSDMATSSATFEIAPVSRIVTDNSIVTADEGTTASNSGIYIKPSTGEVFLSASIGIIVAQADGTWNWSLTVDDGPSSRTVTISAEYDGTDTFTTTFDLTVNNAAPTLTVDRSPVEFVEAGIVTNTGTYSDPGNDTVTLTTSLGMIVDNGDGTWSWSYDNSITDQPQTVLIEATDGDQAVSSVSFDVVVVPRIVADNTSVMIDEGATAVHAGKYFRPENGIIVLSASIGEIMDQDDGTWGWTYDPLDGPEDSQAVIVTAEYDGTDLFATEFELVVNNVAPVVVADQDSVEVIEPNVATNAGTYADVGDDTVSLTASVGIIVDNGDGTWNWSLDNATTNEPRTVVIEATDSDSAVSSVSFEVNFVPRITVDNLSVTVDEGAPAANTGNYVVLGEGTIFLSASIGAIVDQNDGTWNWSYDPVDGPEETQTVIVTAEYDGAEVFTTEFELAVKNVAPVVVADQESVEVIESSVATNAGTYADVGDDTVSLTASAGIIVDNSDGTWSWSLDTSTASEAQTVVIEATDSDQAVASVSFEVIVVPRITANSSSVTVDEGAEVVNTGSYVTSDEGTIVLSASIGEIVDQQDGTWSWSFQAVNGPEESQTVAVFAEYDGADSYRFEFALVVNNVPPAVAVDVTQVTVVDGGTAANSGVFSDVGDDTVSLAASIGTIVDEGNGTWSWTFDSVDGPDDSQIVTIVATDSNGDSSEVTFELVDNDSDSGPLSLDLNNDGIVDVLDTDAIVAEVIARSVNPLFDLSRDGIVDEMDLAQWLLEAAAHNGFAEAYLPGDTNLDGFVDAADLNALALNWRNSVSGWSIGSFNADSRIDAADLNLLALNWRRSIPRVLPEGAPLPKLSAVDTPGSDLEMQAESPRGLVLSRSRRQRP